jgi:hypothetical protein
MICVVSTPEVVARAHAQAQAVFLHTLFRLLCLIPFFLELADSRNHQHQNGVASCGATLTICKLSLGYESHRPLGLVRRIPKHMKYKH